MEMKKFKAGKKLQTRISVENVQRGQQSSHCPVLTCFAFLWKKTE